MPKRRLGMNSNPELVWRHLVKRTYDECGATKADEFIRRVESGEHDVPSPWTYRDEGRRMTFDTIDEQKRTRRWVESRLGIAAMDVHERGMRSAEENIELAQCCGVTEEQYIKLVRHVYSKPIGVVQQELGGAGMTLLALADSVGYVLSECIDTELSRVELLPPDKFRNRQKDNAVNGIGAPVEEVQ